MIILYEVYNNQKFTSFYFSVCMLYFSSKMHAQLHKSHHEIHYIHYIYHHNHRIHQHILDYKHQIAIAAVSAAGAVAQGDIAMTEPR